MWYFLACMWDLSSAWRTTSQTSPSTIFWEANFTADTVAEIGFSLRDGRVWNKGLPLTTLLVLNSTCLVWMSKKMLYLLFHVIVISYTKSNKYFFSTIYKHTKRCTCVEKKAESFQYTACRCTTFRQPSKCWKKMLTHFLTRFGRLRLYRVYIRRVGIRPSVSHPNVKK